MTHANRHPVTLCGPGDWWTPPDDDGLTDCPVCDARGSRMVLDDDGKPWREVCPACNGARYLDSNGDPYDLRAIEHAAQDRG